jgi:signal transduction histidine kinase
MHREFMDLSASIREALAQGRALATHKKIALTVSLGSHPVAVHGDAEALRRLFFIVIDNAIKYTPDAGAVCIALAAENGFAVASVRDSGIGISGQDQPYIFDRFWRADKVRSRGMGGAGLGLSIARWIVERHNGTIQVQSKVGQGSVFSIKLPLASLPVAAKG